MTPLTHTIYSISLFLALTALLRWSKRRRRVSRMVKRAVTKMSHHHEAA